MLRTLQKEVEKFAASPVKNEKKRGITHKRRLFRYNNDRNSLFYCPRVAKRPANIYAAFAAGLKRRIVIVAALPFVVFAALLCIVPAVLPVAVSALAISVERQILVVVEKAHLFAPPFRLYGTSLFNRVGVIRDISACIDIIFHDWNVFRKRRYV